MSTSTDMKQAIGYRQYPTSVLSLHSNRLLMEPKMCSKSTPESIDESLLQVHRFCEGHASSVSYPPAGDRLRYVVMSCTDESDKEDDGGRFEFQVGQVDRGADIAWLSYFPAEAEVRSEGSARPSRTATRNNNSQRCIAELSWHSGTPPGWGAPAAAECARRAVRERSAACAPCRS